VKVLRHFDLSLVAVLEADTLDSAIASCLSQTDSSLKMLCSVAFYSKKLTPIEENYNIGDKELLVIVECL
jgi:hypothetical protein